MAFPSGTYELKGADATREKLLQATHELLVERTGAEPSLSQVCERAGVQTGMVRYCFGGKTEMLEALVDRIRSTVRADLERLAAADLEPEEKLRRNVRAMLGNFASFPYSRQLSEQLRDDGTVATSFAEMMVPFYTALVQEGVRAGTFRKLDPRLLYVSITGMAESLAGSRELFDDERFAEGAIELLLDGIRA